MWMWLTDGATINFNLLYNSEEIEPQIDQKRAKVMFSII